MASTFSPTPDQAAALAKGQTEGQAVILWTVGMYYGLLQFAVGIWLLTTPITNAVSVDTCKGIIMTAEFAVHAYTLTVVFPAPSPAPGVVIPCIAIGPLKWLIVFWAIPLAYDTITFVLTLFKSMQHWRNQVESATLSLLFRDGLIYFAAIFSLILNLRKPRNLLTSGNNSDSPRRIPLWKEPGKQSEAYELSASAPATSSGSVAVITTTDTVKSSVMPLLKPIIAVVTGTGAQGRAVSRAFHNSGLWQVRVLTRNPDGKVATAFRDEGMDVVQANFEDKASLLRAFEGAYAVFSVTIPPWHKMYMHTLGEYDQGVLQADAAKESDVQLFLFSTLPYIGPDYMGLGGVELYDAKARINDYITSIGLSAVYIGTPAFVDNVHSWPLVKKVDGCAQLEFWDYLVEKEKPVVFLMWLRANMPKWVEKDLGPATLAIAESFRMSGEPLSEHPMNHTIQPIGSWRGTWGGVSREIERQTGLETCHTVIPDADGRWHRELTKAFIYQNNHGLYPDVEFPTQATLDLGVKFGTLEEFVRTKIVPMFAK
ncbi:hypothetical protein C0995_016311 [Termitomyces sp. Mi166|nr:hypothetical protein C0995_016311 [Termitomyces sp. Mi166\